MQATVVSIYPLPVAEHKPGQVPDMYRIAACRDKKPVILHINDSIDKRFVGGEFGSVDVPIAAYVIAKSIVEDFCTSVMLSSEEARPGLFFIEGMQTQEQVEKSLFLDTARTRQLAWYLKIVQQADDDWARFRQHKMITQIQRIACRELGFSREWLVESTDARIEKCPACRSFVAQDAIVCASCKAVLKPEEYKKLTFAG